jgi:hypothetical protein
MKPPAQFIKLMMMTTSSHDQEALTAIRKANAILASANVNWEEFLNATEAAAAKTNTNSGFTSYGSQFSRQTSFTDAAEIDPLFDRAFANVSSGASFRHFLESIHEWWENKGYLTEKQLQALRKAATS